MANAAASLQKLLGRLRPYMAVVWFTFATVFIPLGFYLLVEGKVGATQSRIMVLGGFVALALGLITTFIDRKRDRQRDEELHRDIRDLINEIREERNERNDHQPK